MIRNAIIRANSPVASDRAKPRIAIVNIVGRTEGFRAIPPIRLANTTPTPIPAPIRPIEASPAPIYLAACIMSQVTHKID